MVIVATREGSPWLGAWDFSGELVTITLGFMREKQPISQGAFAKRVRPYLHDAGLEAVGLSLIDR